MKKKKIDEAKILFWTRLELKVKIGDKEIGWTGWQAALMHTFIISEAAMTGDGARELVLDGGRAHVDPKAVGCFINEMYKDGLLKIHYERGTKTGKRRRVYRSTLQPGKFKYQKIVHEEEK